MCHEKWASFLNSSGRLTFARSSAKPVPTFVYTCYSSTRYILSKEIHRIPQRNDTFNTQFPNLTTIHCKVSCFEGHVTKYCCYVMLDTIGHVAKYRRTCIRDSTIVFVMRNILRCRDLGRDVLSAKHEQHKPTPTNARHTYKYLLGSMCMIVTSWEKPMSFAMDSC